MVTFGHHAPLDALHELDTLFELRIETFSQFLNISSDSRIGPLPDRLPERPSAQTQVRGAPTARTLTKPCPLQLRGAPSRPNTLSHIVADLRPSANPILSSVLDYVRQAILVIYPNVRTLKSSYNTIKISISKTEISCFSAKYECIVNWGLSAPD